MVDLNVALRFRASGNAANQVNRLRTSMSGLVTAQRRVIRTARVMGSRRLRQGYSQIQRAQDRSQRSFQIAGDMRNAGEAVGQFARVARSAVTSPLAAFELFEDKMQSVRALSDDMTDNTFARMNTMAQNLGATTKFTSVQAAEGFTNLARAGFNAEKQMAALPTTLSLAQAAGSDLGTTADIVTNVLSGFRLEADKLPNVADILTSTFTGSNTTLESLGETMSFAAPTAASLGVSLKEVAAMAGLLGSNAIKGSRAGTSLNAIMTRLSAPRRLGRKALGKGGLDIDLATAAGDLRKPAALFGDILGKLKGMGNIKQSKFISAIFGQEAAPSIKALLSSMKTGELDTFMKRLDDVDGVTLKTAQTMEDSGAGAARSLSSALASLSENIGSTFAPEIRLVRETVTDLVRGIGSWTKAHPTLTKTIMGTVAAVAGVTTVMAGLLVTIATLVSTAGLVTLVGGFSGAAAIIAGPFSLALTGAIFQMRVLATASWMVLKPLLVMAAPFVALGLAVGGVTLAVAGLIENWEKLNLMEGFKGIASSISEDGAFSTFKQLTDIQPQLDRLFGGEDAPRIAAAQGGGAAGASGAVSGRIKVEVEDKRVTIRDVLASGPLTLDVGAGIAPQGG